MANPRLHPPPSPDRPEQIATAPEDSGHRPVRWVCFAEARERLTGLRAVVLDPDVEAAGRIFVSLGQAGAKVRLARRFVAGLQLMDEVRPDLLLASPHLPDGDVLRLFTWLRRGGATRPKLVALGGQAGRQEQRRCLDAGCDVFIRKPIDVRLFAQELAGHLRVQR